MANNNEYTIMLGLVVDPNDKKRLDDEIERIRQNASKMGAIKVNLFDDKLKKAIISYTDDIGRATEETIYFGKEISRLKISENFTKELDRASLQVDKFLERAKKLNQTPSVKATVDKAQEVKTAIAEGDIAKVRKLRDEFVLLRSGMDTAKTGLDGFTSGMVNSIKQTVQYAMSIGLVYGALNQLAQGIEYVSQLNKEMTNIQLLQVEGARSDEQVANLAFRYNSLAKELGATTIQVAEGSVAWLRQGKTIEQTQTLLRSSLMASKLGALESAEATEYLTAILNGFQMEASESTSVVDRLIAVDNIAATSFSELARAMQYSAAVANETGVSFNNLVGYIATVSSTTRLAPEMI